MDDSCRHELDIVVVSATPDYPRFLDILLGIECKAVPKVKKRLIKEALGVRRELSMIDNAEESLLTLRGGIPKVSVNANPPLEFWFAHIDPTVWRYEASPSAFGTKLKLIDP